jgi:hypothetical protein
VTEGGFGRPLIFTGVRRIDRPLVEAPVIETTVYTVYMATIMVCLAILIVFELIDQRPAR